MSGVLLAVWIVACLIVAWGLVAAGYNGDDGWSALFIIAALALIVTGIHAGWLA